VPPDVVSAANQASTDAFRLAMLFNAGLLFAGALVNRFGLRAGVAARSTGAGSAEATPSESAPAA
jgi:hypothetical protein